MTVSGYIYSFIFSTSGLHKLLNVVVMCVLIPSFCPHAASPTGDAGLFSVSEREFVCALFELCLPCSMESSSLTRDPALGGLFWEHGALTPGPSGKFLFSFRKFLCHILDSTHR